MDRAYPGDRRGVLMGVLAMVWPAMAMAGGGLTLDPSATVAPDAGSPGRVGVVVFNNLEEATLVDAGSWYFEQTLASGFAPKSDRSASEFVLQTGVYHALSERLTLAVFVADVSYTSSEGFDGLRYAGSGFQGLLTLVDPESSPVGVAVYSYVGGSERSVSNDTRLVLQVLRGGWNFAYNLRVGTDVGGLDGGGSETVGTLGHSFGVSYAWESAVSVGLEVLVDSRYAEWRRYEGTGVLAGPTVGVVVGGVCAVTVTGLVQLTDEDVPRAVVQVTVGWGF